MVQIFAHTNTQRERRGKTHKSGPAAAAVEYHPQVDQIENVFARLLFAVYFVKRVRE